MLIGQIYFFLERTIETIKKIAYKKIFWIFEKFDAGGSREPKIFLSAAQNIKTMNPFTLLTIKLLTGLNKLPKKIIECFTRIYSFILLVL